MFYYSTRQVTDYMNTTQDENYKQKTKLQLVLPDLPQKIENGILKISIYFRNKLQLQLPVKHPKFHHKDIAEGIQPARLLLCTYPYFSSIFLFQDFIRKFIENSKNALTEGEKIFFLISNICIEKKGNPSTLEVNKGKETTNKNYKSLRNQ